jgi:hypothetical protein
VNASVEKLPLQAKNDDAGVDELFTFDTETTRATA